MMKLLGRSICIVVAVIFAAMIGTADAFVMVEKSAGGIAYSRVFIAGTEEVSISVSWPMDWSWRENENQSIADVGCAALVSGGAMGVSPADVSEQFADWGAELNVKPGVDVITGSFITQRQHIDQAVALAAKLLKTPAFEPTWVVREKFAFLQRIADDRTNPITQAIDAANWARLGNAAVRRAVVGESQDQILHMTPGDLLRWHKAVFRRSGVIVEVAGDVDRQTAGRAVDILIGGLPEGGSQLRSGVAVDFRSRRILLHQPQGKKSVLYVSGQRPPSTGKAEDLVILDALNDPEGPIADALRSKLKATYGFTMQFRDYGSEHRYFQIFGEIEPDRIADGTAALIRAYEDFRRSGRLASLDRNKDLYIRKINDEMLGSADATDWMLEVRRLGGKEPFTVSDLIASVDEIGLANRLAQFPGPEELLVVVVSPDARALPGACVITAPEQAADCN